MNLPWFWCWAPSVGVAAGQTTPDSQGLMQRFSLGHKHGLIGWVLCLLYSGVLAGNVSEDVPFLECELFKVHTISGLIFDAIVRL